MACERVQFAKKTHGDGAGIVRKLDANRKRIPATCASSVQSKTILARSCAAVRSENDQPRTLCNLAGIYIASQGGFQFRYELLLQWIND